MTAPARVPDGFGYATFLQLAVPMIISRAGLAVMGIADAIMVSRHDPGEFARLSLADGTLGRLLDVFIAFMIGSLSVIARHHAEGDGVGAARLWRRALPVALLLGLAGAVAGLGGAPLLRSLGQDPDLAVGAGRITAILGAGYPAALLAIAAALFLEATGRPVVVAVAVIAANLLNIGLNWLLIGGNLGLPALGAEGSALATSLVRWGLGLGLAGLAWTWSARMLVTARRPAGDRETARRQWQLGLGAAATVAVMVGLTSCLTLYAGLLGTLPLAVFAATLSLAAPVALMSLGMADATGVSGGAAAGEYGDRAAGPVGWACLRMTLMPCALLACLLALMAGGLAPVYGSDPAMQAGLIYAIPFAALMLIADSAGFVLASALRALREVAWPAGIDIGAMLLLVPVAWALAFPQGLGVGGLMLAMLLSGCLRAVLLAGRFHWSTRGTLRTTSPAPGIA